MSYSLMRELDNYKLLCGRVRTCMHMGGRAITPSRLCVQSYIINYYSLARLSKRTRSEFPARAIM